MPIIASTTSLQRELIPSGNYIARCYQMIEIGTIKDTIMGVDKILHKIRIGWELPTETKVFKEEHGRQPFVISREYTLSLHEKSTLRKDLKSWRGKDFTEKEAQSFDVTKLIGVPCMINIIHKPSKKDASKMFEEISGITPMPKGVSCPPQVNPNFVLSFDNFNTELFDKLPDFIKIKIKSSMEYSAMVNPHVINADEVETSNASQSSQSFVDDLPF